MSINRFISIFINCKYSHTRLHGWCWQLQLSILLNASMLIIYSRLNWLTHTELDWHLSQCSISQRFHIEHGTQHCSIYFGNNADKMMGESVQIGFFMEDSALSQTSRFERGRIPVFEELSNGKMWMSGSKEYREVSLGRVPGMNHNITTYCVSSINMWVVIASQKMRRNIHLSWMQPVWIMSTEEWNNQMGCWDNRWRRGRLS